LFNLLVIYGVQWLIDASGYVESAVAAAGGIAGIGGALLGKSQKTSGAAQAGAEQADSGFSLSAIAAKLAAPVFAVVALLVIALGTGELLMVIDPAIRDAIVVEHRRGDVVRKAAGAPAHPPETIHEMMHEHTFALRHTSLLPLCAMMVALTLLGWFMGYPINVNKFSLHAMYRNRLIRAYLGASTKDRDPDPFTGFDDRDNVRMHHLRGQRPFHVLNMTLNLSGGGGNLSWQQRQAQSFTMSPLHTGSCRLQQHGAYRDSKDYASYPEKKKSGATAGDYGITLGSAVAISGAAANPNMGYNTSPLVAFLMTLFNARLGAWLGNPGQCVEQGLWWLLKDDHQAPWTRSGPSHSVLPLLAEAFALADQTSPYVCLSDGGHFENLALYEMILRRCQFILVLDNGADAGYVFDGLANAIEKIRVDMAVEIDVPDFAHIKQGSEHFVVGRIRYSNDPAEDGTIVYVKPVLTDDEPADIFYYHSQDTTFPQQTTADQWFSESQFESYRMLGFHSVEKMPLDMWAKLIDHRGAASAGA
jgi:hypothetical protein